MTNKIKFSVGDRLWLAGHQKHNRDSWVEVTKVGRVWLTAKYVTADGASFFGSVKIHIERMEAGDVTSSGTWWTHSVYRTKEEHVGAVWEAHVKQALFRGLSGPGSFQKYERLPIETALELAKLMNIELPERPQ